VTIQGRSFPHLIYHFVLTYSNWESGTVRFSESFESLSEGFQNALWGPGQVPHRHRTERLSTAVNNMSDPVEFTDRYKGLMRLYGLESEKTQAGHGNENGDVEQRHHRLKRAVGQELMLRDSVDFASVEEYRRFLAAMFERLNAGRRQRLVEEMAVMRELPERRMESAKREQVEARLYMDRWRSGMGRRWWRRCRACARGTSIAWTTGTSSTGWCASRVLWNIIGTATSCSRPAASI
jgi:hypothetical protein